MATTTVGAQTQGQALEADRTRVGVEFDLSLKLGRGNAFLMD